MRFMRKSPSSLPDFHWERKMPARPLGTKAMSEAQLTQRSRLRLKAAQILLRVGVRPALGELLKRRSASPVFRLMREKAEAAVAEMKLRGEVKSSAVEYLSEFIAAELVALEKAVRLVRQTPVTDALPTLRRALAKKGAAGMTTAALTAIVVDQCAVQPASVKKHIQRLRKKGAIEQVVRGRWRLTRRPITEGLV